MTNIDKLIYNLKYYPGQPKHEEKLKNYVSALNAENERAKEAISNHLKVCRGYVSNNGYLDEYKEGK